MKIKLQDCPICHAPARMEYACSDYFIVCSPRCLAPPMCDHPSPESTALEWNNWVDNYTHKLFFKLRVLIRNKYITFIIKMRLRSMRRKVRYHMIHRLHLDPKMKMTDSKMNEVMRSYRSWRLYKK